MTQLAERPTGPPGARPTPARRVGRPVAVGLLVLVGLAAVAASVLVGARLTPLAALTDPAHPLHAVYEARLERTVLALVVGAALGLAGAVLQGLTRNPLAEPGILGINAGAAFAMVVAISFLGVSDLQQYVWFAFLGGGLAALVVHLVASLGREGATPVKLAIAGAAFTAAATGWTSAVLLVDRSTMETFRLWQVGTVGGRDLDVLLTGLPFLLAGAALVLPGARVLNALALGDDLARGLGRRTALDRAMLGLAAVLLAGAATALAGPIAFVGLMAPHAVRTVVGSDYRAVLPLAALAGATVTVLADTVGRVVLPPSEVQVGIMTAVLGAPAFLWLVRRGRVGAAL